MDDARLSLNALVLYIRAGGEVMFHDSGASHPARDKAFTLSYTIKDQPLYDHIWRRLMVQDVAGKAKPPRHTR